MAATDFAPVLGHIRKLAYIPGMERSDTDLLDRFAREGDQEAFSALVKRHGPLVWRVCRRLLHHVQDAEDAWQAVFLILARRAGSIREPAALASWLHRTAFHIAHKLRIANDRRRSREKRAGRSEMGDACYEIAWQELGRIIEEEVHRLADKYRLPLLLVYWEDETHEEAAKRLGWPSGTVKTRLAKARRLLHSRLVRRGVSLPAGGAALLLVTQGSGAVPERLLATIPTLAALRAPGMAIGIAPQVAALAERGVKGLSLFYCKWALALTLAIGTVVGATALFQSLGSFQEPKQNMPKSAAAGKESASLASNGDAQTELTDRSGDPLPVGAAMRLGTTRFRYFSNALAFLPDGRTVVSSDQHGGIKIWDPRNGRLIREIDTGYFSGGGNGGFSLSRDGKSLAMGGSISGDGKPGFRSAVAVFDLATGKAIRTIERQPREGVNGLTMSPDGKLLFSLDRDGILRIEEVATGAELLLRQKFPGDVMAHLALSPDGSTLALASGPNTRKLFVWNWQAAEEPREIKSGGDRPDKVIFSPDGKLLAECADSDPDVRIIDVASGRLLRKLELPDQEPYWHHHIAFAPNGKLVAAYGMTNDGGAVHLWDPATGRFVKRLPNIGGALAFSPDNQLLVAGSFVWDFATGKDLSADSPGHRNAIERIVPSRNGLIATAGDGPSICLWDGATGALRRQFHADISNGLWLRDFAVSPDGKLLVASSMRDDAVYLWNVETGQRIYRLPGHGRMGSAAAAAAFLPDGKSFFTFGATDMRLRRWDVRTGKALAEVVIQPAGIRIPSEDDEPHERDRRAMMFHVGAVHFTPDVKTLVLQMGTTWYVFDARTGQAVRSFSTGGARFLGMADAAISPDNKLVLASAFGQSIQIRLPDGSISSSLPNSHSMTLWNLKTGAIVKQITMPEQRPGPVAFSPDCKRFAVASSQPGTRIRLMDTATCKEVRKIEGFRGVVRSLAFMPDGRRLVSGMEDGSALVWDLAKDR